jgi:hypothetical protein
MINKKWNGRLNKIIEETDDILFRLNGTVFYAQGSDIGDPKPEIIDLVNAAIKLNKLAKYAIESGRVSPLKALEVMGEKAKIEDITEQ